MPQAHFDQVKLPISYFKNINDSGQLRSFARRDDYEVKDPLFVREDQQGQDFSHNAKFVFNGEVSWTQFVNDMTAISSTEFNTKADACLFAPTKFETKLYWNGNGAPYKGFRCKQNATTSSAAVVDADNKIAPVLLIHEAIDRIRQEQSESVVYTTANNKSGDRFRVVIPFAEPVDPDTQQRAVQAICRMLKVGWKSDASKNNCYSLFYVPGLYNGAVNEFYHLKGKIRTAQEWIDRYPEPEVAQPATPPPKPEGEGADLPAGEWEAEVEGLHILDEYRALRHDRHKALYGLAVKLAMSAINFGYQITRTELYDLLECEYRNNTPKSPYTPNELKRIAREAIDNAKDHIGDDPAYARPRMKSYAEEELEADIKQSKAGPPPPCPDDFFDEDFDDDAELGKADDEVGKGKEEEEAPPQSPNPEPDPDPEPERKIRSRRFFDEYLDLPEFEYWDEDKILPKKLDGTTCLVTGPWGCHKTNVTLTMMMDAVIKKDARVLFVPCEGAYGLAKLRVPAHCANRGFDIRQLRGRFEFLPDGIDLTQSRAVKEFIVDNADFMPDIVVIDTLAQAVPGIDMNTSLVGSLLGTNGPVGAIRRAFGCLVLILCHPPKSDDNAVLGHNSIVGNTDMILRVYSDKEKHTVTVKVKRNKDGPEGQELYYSFNPTGVPVPVRAERDNGLPPGAMGPRDHEADFMSQIKLIIKLDKLNDWQKSLGNQEMAGRLTPRIGGVTSDEEWNADVKRTVKKLSNIQNRIKDGSPYLKLCRKIKIPHSRFKDGEWRWYTEPSDLDPVVEDVLNHVNEPLI